MWKIHKENNSDLNFALANLYSQTIDIKEFNSWVEMVVSQTSINEIPTYLFELIEFNQSLFHISKIIGFVPENNLSESEQNALTGISFLRNIDVYDPPISREKALQALKENSHILDEFKRFFPFIEI